MNLRVIWCQGKEFGYTSLIESKVHGNSNLFNPNSEDDANSSVPYVKFKDN